VIQVVNRIQLKLKFFCMKKSFTPIILIAFLGLFISLAFSGGRASGADEGNTGAPGDAMNGANPLTCQYCHSSGAFGPPNMSIELYDSAATNKLTTYKPGLVHTIRVTLVATGAPRGYGFQMIDIKKTGNTPVKGFLAQASQTATNVQIATTSAGSTTPNRTYAEHKGTSVSPIFNVKWRAPAKGAGAVVFYAAGNAVNTDGNQTGDGSTSTNQEFGEGTTATKDLTENIRFEVFSGSNTEGVSLLLTSDRARSVTVRATNLAGQIIGFDKWEIATGDNIRALHLGTTRGAYLIQVIDKQTIITKKIIKF
jgi:hypothetical protein